MLTIAPLVSLSAGMAACGTEEYAVEVRGHHFAPGFERCLLDRAEVGDASVVDEAVDAPPGGERVGDHGVNLLGDRDIVGQREDAVEAGGGGSELVGVAINAGNFAAFGEELFGCRQSNSARGARNDCGLFF